MGFILRMEGAALAALEQKEAEASSKGPEVYKAFKEQSSEEAVEESKKLGLSDAEDSGGSSSSSESSDSSDSGDSSDSSDSSDGSGEGDSESEGESDDDLDAPEIPDLDDEEDDESSDEEEEEPEEEEEVEEEEEAEVKKESFRTLSFLPDDPRELRLESFQEFGSAALNSTWNGVSFVASSLLSVGIRFAPWLLTSMFKITLFVFAKTFKTLDSIFDYLSTSITRYVNRTSKQKEKIGILKQSLNNLREKQAILPEGSILQSDVRFLTNGLNNNVIENIAVYTAFMNSKVEKLHTALLSDFRALKSISEARYLNKNFDALKFMPIRPETFGFNQNLGNVDGMNISVEKYSMGKMIGNVQLVGEFGTGYHDNWNGVEKAYNSSKIIIEPSMDQQNVKTPLLNPDQLAQFLNNLELLAEVSLRHQKFYEEISKERSGVINSVKQLFIRLAEENVKVSFKNSVALPLHLKSSFAAKVYMTSAMDLHDHTARVIANGLVYASSMMSLYKADSK